MLSEKRVHRPLNWLFFNRTVVIYDKLHENGTVSIILIPAHEYECDREKYDKMLGPRCISVPDNEYEPPRCKGDVHGGDVVFTRDQLAEYSIARKDILNGVSSIRLCNARPIVGLNSLIVGAGNVFVKAYGNQELHGCTDPIIGVLNDNNFKTEAIIFATIAYDFKEPCDNAVYLSNLVEWLWQRRSQSRRYSQSNPEK